MPAAKKDAFAFESALKELNTLVDALEKGDLSLEDSLKTFEKGIGLTRQCQEALQNAQQKVQILISQDKDSDLADFHEAE